MNKSISLVQKILGFILLILITFSLILGELNFGLIICYIGISTYNGVRAVEKFKNKAMLNNNVDF
ncbi:hypothetical protein [Robertmurraya sp. P23]|uniref:hypothetical protein n=1 Tax=Robertmurraya sp. P23 TaxID=3436931 RepID=UPI003D9521A1